MLPIQNMVNLLKASYTNVISNFPQARNILYDADNQSFYNKNSGRRYSDEDVKKIAGTQQSRSANAGLATLKRTAIANTILQGTVQEGRGRTIQEASRERLGDGIEKTLYSKKPPQKARVTGKNTQWKDQVGFEGLDQETYDEMGNCQMKSELIQFKSILKVSMYF